MAIAYNTSIVTNGLVLCFDASNKKGGLNVVPDLSANGNTGTLTNGVIRNISGSINFDGNGDAITTPSTTNLNLSAVNNFTIEGWFRCNSLKNGNTVLSLGTARSALYWVMGVGYSSGELFFGTGSGSWGWSQQQITSGAGVVAGIWTHVAVVRNGTTLTIYKDGVSVYTNASWNFGSGQSGTLHIGTYFNNTNSDGSWFDGSIYNLRIVTGTSIYTGNFTPSPFYGYVSGTILLVGRSGIIDEGDNLRSLTTAGDVVAVTSDNFSFDGVNDSIITSKNIGISGDFNATLSVWIKFIELSTGYRCVCMFGGTGSMGGFSIFSNLTGVGSGSVAVGFYGSNNAYVSSGLTTNTWFNIVATKTTGAVNASNTKLYINGQLQTLTFATSLTPNATNAVVYVGNDPSNEVSNTMNVANFLLYNRALSAAEVQQNFAATRSRYGI